MIPSIRVMPRRVISVLRSGVTILNGSIQLLEEKSPQHSLYSVAAYLYFSLLLMSVIKSVSDAYLIAPSLAAAYSLTHTILHVFLK